MLSDYPDKLSARRRIIEIARKSLIFGSLCLVCKLSNATLIGAYHAMRKWQLWCVCAYTTVIRFISGQCNTVIFWLYAHYWNFLEHRTLWRRLRMFEAVLARTFTLYPRANYAKVAKQIESWKRGTYVVFRIWMRIADRNPTYIADAACSPSAVCNRTTDLRGSLCISLQVVRMFKNRGYESNSEFDLNRSL
jgi:hypothetical protein